MLEEICGIFWGGFYGIYCLCMCGTCCKEEYEARIKKRERIINEYDRISSQRFPPEIEIRYERSVTTPLSTIEEEVVGYQDFRSQQLQ